MTAHETEEPEVASMREELGDLTSRCKGYRDTKHQGERPAKMCNSPDYRYPWIQIWAGRILELIEPWTYVPKA